jgi:hypothetical protein
MPERQPNHSEAPTDEPWIEGNVQHALSSDVEPAHDLFFGDGEGHWFGPHRTAYVAFYPTHRAVEFQNANQIFSPRQACQVTVVDDAVFVDLVSARERSFATFGRDGSFSSSSVPIPLTYTAHEQDVIDHLHAAAESSSGSAGHPIRQGDVCSADLRNVPPTSSPAPLREPIMSETVIETPAADLQQDLKHGEEILVEGVVHQSLMADRKTGELKTRAQIYAYAANRLHPHS